MSEYGERMKHHLYSNEGRVEQCERICKLEELVSLMTFVLERMEQATTVRFEGDGITMDSSYFKDKLKELEVPDA